MQLAPGMVFEKNNHVAGRFETYYKNGKLCEKGELVNHRLIGKYECFYEDGSPFVAAEFDTESQLGAGKCYYRSGAICQQGDILTRKFSEGAEKRVIATNLAPDGYSPLGDSYGIPYADHFFSDALYEGLNCPFDFAPWPRLLRNFKSFNKDGKHITFVRDGIKTSFGVDGKIILQEACNDKLQKHGQSSTYSSGSLRKIESYVNGIQEGLYLELSYHGFVRQKGAFLAGKKVGDWEYFDENGVPTQY